MQSEERCFPMEIVLVKDEKETIFFADIFRFMGDGGTDVSKIKTD